MIRPKVNYAVQFCANTLLLCNKRGLCTTLARKRAFLDKITIIGAGHMGSGIGQISAAAGNCVIVADVSENALSKARERMEQRLWRFSKKHWKDDEEKIKENVQGILNNITFTTDIQHAVKNCDLVVEAIPEDLELKHKMLQEIDKVAKESAIFATNTSSLRVCEIGQCLSEKRRERFCGTHFFEPVAVKLVEVVRIPETVDEVYHQVMEFITFIGKVPVTCKDVPGFIVNRLNIPYLMNACNMYERGDATIQDIDTAMKLGAGYPYGPFELADYVGIDVIYMIFKGWEKRFSDNQSYKCPQIIIQLYEQGKYGKKSGHGFYSYAKI